MIHAAMQHAMRSPLQSAMDRIGSAVWTPATLFAASEQGVWYDPSDFSTMFQNSAGTTPVTAVGQPVGLLLDKSKGLVLGPEMTPASTGWTGSGTWTVNTVLNSASVAGASGSADDLTLGTMAGAYVGQIFKVTFTVNNITSGGVTVSSSRTSGSTVVTSAGTYSQFLTVTLTGPGVLTLNISAAGTSCTVSGISIKELLGNHATQATAAARPVLQQDGNGKHYLAFDGVDDGMATAAIDFTATDKMSVFAGVHKVSSGDFRAIIELSASITANSGAFVVFGPNGVNNDYAFVSKGTVLSEATANGFESPITNVVVGVGSIGTDSSLLRVNGVQVAQAASDQGSGNFGNYQLYIGSRAGTSLRFNGRIYSMIVRGTLSDAAQIAAAEAYVNSKTGAY